MPESSSETPIHTNRRVSILDEESTKAFPSFDQLDRQWFLLSGAIQRDMATNLNVRKQLVPFCSVPLSETLPQDMLNSLSSMDTRVKRLADRYRSQVSSYLALPTVPDNLIRPDIANAPPLEFNMWDVSSKSGITRQERWMVAKRYQYARDA